VRGKGGAFLRKPEEERLRLPPGYRLDRSDLDVRALRRAGGWAVAYFSVRGATEEAVERIAWEGHESGAGEEEYP
jgi:hypothetical protein